MALGTRDGRTLGRVSWRFLGDPSGSAGRHVAVVGARGAPWCCSGCGSSGASTRSGSIKATVEARQDEPAVDVQDVLPHGAGVGDARSRRVEHRLVTAHRLLRRRRHVRRGEPHVQRCLGQRGCSPRCVLDDGSAVVVNRGFLGFDQHRCRRIRPPAPEDTVVRVGRAAARERAARPVRPERPRRRGAHRAGVGRPRPCRRAGGSTTLLPRPTCSGGAVQLRPRSPSPATGHRSWSLSVDWSLPTEGLHLVYAVQWFIFTAIAAVGYVLLLRRVAP